MTKYHVDPTLGEWVYEYGAIYAVNGDNKTRIILADRNTDQTSPAERDQNLKVALLSHRLIDPVKALLEYRQRNTLNFQLEKLDDYLNALQAIIDEVTE